MTNFLVAAFGSNEFTTGFELVGVKTIISTTDLDEYHCSKLLFETLKRNDIGLLIVEEHTLEELSQQDRFIVENYLRPVVVVLTEKPNDGSLRRQIRRAIGIDIYEH